MTLDSKKLRALALGAVLGGVVLAVPHEAKADEVSPTGKGIVGGALLGGEVVVFGEAIFGVHSTVAYIIGGAVGAAGGGVGGYFVEKGSSDGRIPAYMLAGGIAALIPAIVVTLDATRYMPTEGAREDKPADVPPPDPGQPGGSSVIGAPASTPPASTAPGTTPPATTPPDSTPPATPPATTPPATTPPATTPPGGATTGGNPHVASAARSPALVGLRNGQLAIGVPVPEVRPILGGTSERTRMGIENRGSELRFSVLHVTF